MAKAKDKKGSGKSKKDAEQAAASEVLDSMSAPDGS